MFSSVNFYIIVAGGSVLLDRHTNNGALCEYVCVFVSLSLHSATHSFCVRFVLRSLLLLEFIKNSIKARVQYSAEQSTEMVLSGQGRRVQELRKERKCFCTSSMVCECVFVNGLTRARREVAFAAVVDVSAQL